jgi:hypothetical protein
MKKPFFAMFLIVLLIGSFLGGAWYSQNETGKNSAKDRRILHYVDPMNPVNVSDKPGIAPCGMPMEPVYGNDDSAGPSSIDTVLSMPPGTVKITPLKQQIIGVQIGVVEKIPSTYEIRTLGRIAPDENRIYPLIAATNGWTGDIQGNTTGSLVNKDQFMALIKVYDYDFFTWQQRYLAELANRGQRRHPNTPTEERQVKPLELPQTAVTQPETQEPAGMSPSAIQQKEIPTGILHTESTPPKQISGVQQAVEPQPETIKTPEGRPFAGMTVTAPQPGPPAPGMQLPGKKETEVFPADASQQEPRQIKGKLAPLTLGLAQKLARDPLDDRADAALYANKSELELLNLGVGEGQLEELARTAKYVSSIELRSPVNGIVISRDISSYQRVDRGTECFRVADIDRVWVIADVFSAEAQFIRPGMTARISLPGQSTHYEAKVIDVLPKFDAATRSLKVRLEVDNPKYVLLPEMFVDVDFQIPLPSAMTVPTSAVLDSGRKQTVFVALGDGFFEPRTVTTGWRSGDRVEIVEGLQAGEQIVISGNFLIDSESRMRLAAAGLSGMPENASPGMMPQGAAAKKLADKEKMSAPGPSEHKHD